ncbi:hypothetical protein [Streptococcus equi]|uniref:hypothetical protein n=1 Tax=Streptococcus equi TaxID=1336 RepID=UPI001E3B0F01
MKKTMKKMLAASTLCIIMSGSFIGGSARVLAEQYYGYDDGTQKGGSDPAFLYVSPKDNPNMSAIVYCFNKENTPPNPWKNIYGKNQKSYNTLFHSTINIRVLIIYLKVMPPQNYEKKR